MIDTPTHPPTPPQDFPMAYEHFQHRLRTLQWRELLRRLRKRLRPVKPIAKLMSVADAVDEYGLTASHLYDLIDSRQIKAKKRTSAPNSHWKINRASLDAYIERDGR